MDSLPIDPLVPAVVAALRDGPAVVVEAPPGAGKTTRIPAAIAAAGIVAGEVVVLEPRRLAARLAARRVAGELGEEPGGTVGYQVRFEDVTGPRTRIRYVTEGLLTRRLVSAPTLPGVGAVILDEFHERHLPGDLALALLRRLQRTARPDLKLVAMSATLDASPVARFLGAPALRSEGRRFEVAIEHLSPEEAARAADRLEDRVARAVRRLLAEEPDGHLLVFLPGAAEIRWCAARLAPLAAAGVEVLPLHGDLPPAEQDRAVRPSARRKVILSTNVAESSVTVDGVVAVVDSGLARVASHSPWSGLPTLELRRISRASAAQRAGRAGRTRPGRALRLYTRHDHDTRPEHDLAEVLREDLAEPFLALAGLGALAGPDRLEWFEPPPPAAAEAARALLSRLGAIAADGGITPLGRRLLALPAHPRQARLAIAAADRGAAAGGALLAALLGERDLRDRRAGGPLPPTGPSDLLELASLFEEASRARFGAEACRRLGVDPGAAQAVDRARRQLLGALGRVAPERAGPRPAAPAGEALDDALLAATLAAYPDRVARRRAPGEAEVVLVGGGSATLDPASVVRADELLVAVDAEERRGDRRAPGGPPGRASSRVRLASRVTREDLLDVVPEELSFRTQVSWNGEAERVEAVEQLCYGDLVLESSRAAAPPPEAVAAALAEAALARGVRAFAPEGAIDRLLARLALAGRCAPASGLAPPPEEELRAALGALCAGRRSFAELRDADLVGALLARLSPGDRAQLERLAPERVALGGGRQVRVEYEPGRPPWIASRLQDFFGMVRGPAVGGGAEPVTLHLLAPNQRAVQVTADLSGFWERHYPAVRRELSRRYPRHAWPEDPARSAPPGRHAPPR